MAVAPEKGFETLSGKVRLGSIEHIEACARLAEDSAISTTAELQEFLQTHFIPESLAYFIFDNRTAQTRTFWTPDKTAVLDTRNLPGYNSGPVFDAEYNYDPANDNNYIFIYGRPYPHEIPEYNYGYHLRMYLTNSLDLDTNRHLEASIYLGDSHKPLETQIYRTYADINDPRYAAEHNPATFVNALQETAEGFKKYLNMRDYM